MPFLLCVTSLFPFWHPACVSRLVFLLLCVSPVVGRGLWYVLSIALITSLDRLQVTDRGLGVGCEAPYLRSIAQKFLEGLFTLLIYMHLLIQPLKAGLCHGIHGIPFLLCCRGGVFLIKRAKRIICTTSLLSEPSESQESGNHQLKQDNASNFVSNLHARLAPPALQ